MAGRRRDRTDQTIIKISAKSFTSARALQCFKKFRIKNKNPKIIYIYIYVVTKIKNKKPKIVRKLA